MISRHPIRDHNGGLSNGAIPGDHRYGMHWVSFPNSLRGKDARWAAADNDEIHGFSPRNSRITGRISPLRGGRYAEPNLSLIPWQRNFSTAALP